jgi:hypothetical protein
VNDKIFTRAQFIARLRKNNYPSSMIRELLERWDMGAKLYGAFDLTSRDWLKEAWEEELDRVVYTEAAYEQRDRALETARQHGRV